MPQPTSFALATDGDLFERRYWSQFLEVRFPSYERFWLQSVVPVTRRVIDRSDVRLLSDTELAAAGRTHEDLAIAQLHYTVMVHLGRARDLTSETLDRWTFAEVLVRLTGASDCADELLERATNRGTYDAWSEDAGRRARNRWRDVHGRPLATIHEYRNRLVHGRVVPEVTTPDPQSGERIFIYPRLDRVNEFLDWRVVFEDLHGVLARGDFAPAQTIGRDAWNQVIDYCNASWEAHLSPLDAA